MIQLQSLFTTDGLEMVVGPSHKDPLPCKIAPSTVGTSMLVLHSEQTNCAVDIEHCYRYLRGLIVLEAC